MEWYSYAAAALIFVTGFVIGGWAGWISAGEAIRKANRERAAAMAASVGAKVSKHKAEDMLEYRSRQRVKDNNNNGKRARQAIVRAKRVMRRPERKH